MSVLSAFFTFPDGRLHYDCVRCGSECCRGHGYALTEKELLVQLHRRPDIAMFVTRESSEGSDELLVGNFAPGCFFLTASGQCELHVDLGYEAKPRTCRHFPFNHFRQIAGTLLVSPHDQLCPLQVTPAEVRHQHSSHAELLRDIAPLLSEGNVPRVVGLRGRDAEDVALERALLQRADEFAGCERYSEYFVHQLEAMPHLTAAASVARARAAARRFQEEFAELIGTPAQGIDRQDASLTSLMVVLTSTLRTRVMFRPAARAFATALDAAEAARFTMAAYSLLTVAGNANIARPTVQTVFALVSRFEPLLWLAARAQEGSTWRLAPALDLALLHKSPLRPAVLRWLKETLRRQLTPRESVQLLARSADQCEASYRPSFLLDVARLVYGRVASPHSTEAGARPMLRFRAMVQRRSLALLPERLVDRLLVRIGDSSRSPTGRLRE